MPHAEPLPIVGKRCGALRVRDAEQNWRIVYRVDSDAVLVLEVYAKKSRKVPDEVVKRCRQRLHQYDSAVPAEAKRKKGK
jgi:phage-related protein